jgi:hypothetical protein
VTVAAAVSIHASAVLIGARAALIRGPSGCGKSRLAFALVNAAESGLLRFARLVGDDRVHVEATNGRLLARPVPELAGLIEVHGLGIRRLPFERVAVATLVVDLGETSAERLPPESAKWALIAGIRLARLAVAPGADAMPLVLGALRTAEA